MLIIETVNTDKDSWFTIYSPTKIRPNTNLPTLHIEDRKIPRTSSVKYLGLHIDENLNFKGHIEQW